MKLTTFILIISLVQVSAMSFGQKINLNEKNAPLKKIIEAISAQSGFEVFYLAKDIENKKVDIDLSDASIEQAMTKVLINLPLTFKIFKKNIVLTKTCVLVDKTEKTTSLLDKAFDLFSTPIRISGRVTDSLGNALEGATLFVLKKSKNGEDNTKSVAIILSKSGEFEVEAEDGDHIFVSFMGYSSKTFVVKDGMAFQHVILDKAMFKLNEVMVQTGYQTISKERSSGSFGKPDMKIFSKRTGTLDVVGRLEGLVPGLQVSVTEIDGILGASTRKSLIRGTSSVQNQTQPLFVVNGVIVDNFVSVNADDIEDITVLKDAAASAIWGAKSASGVIVIKTKSGTKNGKVAINYSGFINYSPKPDLGYSNMLSSRQYIDVAKEIFDPIAYSWESQKEFVAPHDRILYDQYRHLITPAIANQRLDSLAAINNRSQIEKFYRGSFTSNHTVSASGGNNIYSFYASLGYSGSRGNSSGSRKTDSYKINFSQSLSIGPRVQFSLNTSLINDIANTGNPLQPTTAFLPYQLFSDAVGNPLNMTYMNGFVDSLTRDYQARSHINLDYNPINETRLRRSNDNNLNVNVTANLTVKLWKGLQFMGTYGYVKSLAAGNVFIDHQTIEERKKALSLTVAPTVKDVPEYYYPLTGENFTRNEYDQRNWTVRNQLAYTGSLIANRDQISIQAGQEIQQSSSFSSQANLLGYEDALGSYAILDNEKLRKGIFPSVTGSGFFTYMPYLAQRIMNRSISYFALVDYAFDSKYSVNASIRQDFSNQFASEVSTQNKPIWSLGGRWEISKEHFMESIKWLDQLGLRLTYGITGNSPYTGAASKYDIIVALNKSFLPNMIAGDAFAVNSPGNKTLAWENTNNLNLGLDYSLLKGRLSGGIDLYKRVTTDLLGTVILNPLTGYPSLNGNVGKLVNNGIEINIHSQNISTKSFNWSTNLTLGFNRNKLISYSKADYDDNTVSGYLSGIPVAGYSMNPLWAYRYAGLDKNGDPQIFLNDNSVTKKANVTKVEDLKYMGTKTPVCSGGFSNTFSYKSISVSANMIYNFGAVMFKDVNIFYNGRLAGGGGAGGSFSNSGNIPAYFLDRWKKSGDEAFTDIPAYTSDAVANSNRDTRYYTSGDLNVMNSSYLTIRDITLSLELKPAFLKSINIQHANVFMQATNFLVWVANDQGINPELPLPSSGAAPVRHSYSLGINLSF